jgi:hypothetical protein
MQHGSVDEADPDRSKLVAVLELHGWVDRIWRRYDEIVREKALLEAVQ